jgi:hypothetical protein
MAAALGSAFRPAFDCESSIADPIAESSDWATCVWSALCGDVVVLARAPAVGSIAAELAGPPSRFVAELARVLDILIAELAGIPADPSAAKSVDDSGEKPAVS